MYILDSVSQNESHEFPGRPGAAASVFGDIARAGRSDGRWPCLRSSRTEPGEGENPEVGDRCVLGYHHGYHRDSNGAEWLDNE